MLCCNCSIGMKSDRLLGSTAAEEPIKFQGDTMISTANLSASRLDELLRYYVTSVVEMDQYILR